MAAAMATILPEGAAQACAFLKLRLPLLMSCKDPYFLKVV